jgi:hypothetical protein
MWYLVSLILILGLSWTHEFNKRKEKSRKAISKVKDFNIECYCKSQWKRSVFEIEINKAKIISAEELINDCAKKGNLYFK